jgi:hypothetical protein
MTIHSDTPFAARPQWRNPRAPRQALAAALALLAAVAGWLWPLAATAHEMRPIIATAAVAGERLAVTMSLNLEAVVAGIGPEHDNTADSPAAPAYDRLRRLPPAELTRAFAAMAPQFLGDIHVAIGERPLALGIADIAVPDVGDVALPRISEITLTGPLPAGPGALTWQLARPLGDSVLRIRDPATGEIVGTDYVTAGETSVPLALGEVTETSWQAVFVQYLEVGFVHIVPMGLDHILFVIGLFLLSTSFTTLLLQVSAFTVAHSITLALATLGYVSLPASIVEPLIAASIAYIAIENLFTTRMSRWRLLIIFGFGLLHGLGFAGVLGEIGLSPAHFVTALVGFNFGVEAGQLAVILACFLLTGLAMRKPWYRRAIVTPTSIAIGCIAADWMVERTGLL